MKSCLWLASLLLVVDDSNPVCASSCPAGCYRYYSFGCPQSTIQNREHLDQYESGHLFLWGRCRRSLARGMIKLHKPLRSRPLYDTAWPPCPQVSVSESFVDSYIINPFISLWSCKTIKVARLGLLNYVATTFVCTREDRYAHIRTIFHISSP